MNMSEADWLISQDPNPMLASLPGKTTGRKLRLFACGCFRVVFGHLVTDKTLFQAIEVAERFADGLASDAELETARQLAASAKARAAPGTKVLNAIYVLQAATRTDWSDELRAFADRKSRGQGQGYPSAKELTAEVQIRSAVASE